MILELLLLMGAQEDVVRVRRETTTIAGPVWPSELSDQVRAYLSCLMPEDREPINHERAMQDVHQGDVTRCEELKSEMVISATLVWSSTHPSADANQEVTDLFDRLAAHHVDMGAQIDALISNSAPAPEHAAND
ncbi:hypothetical protein [Aurantiacibacter gilvus]|uniref:Uncharacterized protein n=1 Tax=Aurantiacibacter gilvus TaxID=3139141 RepID=A0ABU9IHE2_9SPHN